MFQLVSVETFHYNQIMLYFVLYINTFGYLFVKCICCETHMLQRLVKIQFCLSILKTVIINVSVKTFHYNQLMLYFVPYTNTFGYLFVKFKFCKAYLKFRFTSQYQKQKLCMFELKHFIITIEFYVSPYI